MTDRQQRKALLASVNNTCPRCGAIHGQTIRKSERTGNLWVTYLQIMHPDHDAWNPDARKEIACNGCHMSNDGPLHTANARKTRELRKNGQAKRYQRNGLTNYELVKIAAGLGIDLVYEPDEAGGAWHWHSEISTGSHREMAMALSQALYDLVATYRELAVGAQAKPIQHNPIPEEVYNQ
jgi:hypothetical protein